MKELIIQPIQLLFLTEHNITYTHFKLWIWTKYKYKWRKQKYNANFILSTNINDAAHASCIYKYT